LFFRKVVSGVKSFPGDASIRVLFPNCGEIPESSAASHSWIMPQERGLHSVLGEPFVWAPSVVPICALLFLVDLAWGAFIIARQQWRSGSLWLMTIPIWLIAVIVDFAHH
jgi:hypothetical protein